MLGFPSLNKTLWNGLDLCRKGMDSTLCSWSYKVHLIPNGPWFVFFWNWEVFIGVEHYRNTFVWWLFKSKKVSNGIPWVVEILEHCSFIVFAFGSKLCFFWKVIGRDELSPPEYSFHRCRTSREVEGCGANPNTIGLEKYSGERDYNTNNNNT
jgi:hypothetical protein